LKCRNRCISPFVDQSGHANEKEFEGHKAPDPTSVYGNKIQINVHK